MSDHTKIRLSKWWFTRLTIFDNLHDTSVYRVRIRAPKYEYVVLNCKLQHRYVNKLFIIQYNILYNIARWHKFCLIVTRVRICVKLLHLAICKGRYWTYSRFRDYIHLMTFSCWRFRISSQGRKILLLLELSIQNLKIFKIYQRSHLIKPSNASMI